MSNFSLGLKGKLIGKALINESLLICIRCCQKNVKGNVFNIVDEKKWGSTSSHLTAKLIPPPPPTTCRRGEFISEVLFLLQTWNFTRYFEVLHTVNDEQY